MHCSTSLRLVVGYGAVWIFLRYSGVKFQNSGLGYSLHSQIATTTRFASLLAGTLIAIAMKQTKLELLT